MVNGQKRISIDQSLMSDDSYLTGFKIALFPPENFTWNLDWLTAFIGPEGRKSSDLSVRDLFACVFYLCSSYQLRRTALLTFRRAVRQQL